MKASPAESSSMSNFMYLSSKITYIGDFEYLCPRIPNS